jgi:hypothetical protein
MTITRADVEAILIQRCGAYLTAASMDGTSHAGTNESLNDPIGYALRKIGYSVANVSLIDDDDLSGVSEIDQLFDLAELRTLDNILGNLALVDITLGPRKESLSQLASALEKRIARLHSYIELEYGIGMAELTGGVIELDFAEHEDGYESPESLT